MIPFSQTVQTSVCHVWKYLNGGLQPFIDSLSPQTSFFFCCFFFCVFFLFFFSSFFCTFFFSADSPVSSGLVCFGIRDRDLDFSIRSISFAVCTCLLCDLNEQLVIASHNELLVSIRAVGAGLRNTEPELHLFIKSLLTPVLAAVLTVHIIMVLTLIIVHVEPYLPHGPGKV